MGEMTGDIAIFKLRTFGLGFNAFLYANRALVWLDNKVNARMGMGK